jgi:hypothetical protein
MFEEDVEDDPKYSKNANPVITILATAILS